MPSTTRSSAKRQQEKAHSRNTAAGSKCTKKKKKDEARAKAWRYSVARRAVPAQSPSLPRVTSPLSAAVNSSRFTCERLRPSLP